MIIGTLVLAAVGILFLVMGIMIYRGRISLIHDYHYSNVKEQDRHKYCKEMGKGMLTLAVGIIAAAVASVFNIVWIMLVLIFVPIIPAFMIFNKAEKKYNGGWFS